jgi:hypothetical protein
VSSTEPLPLETVGSQRRFFFSFFEPLPVRHTLIMQAAARPRMSNAPAQGSGNPLSATPLFLDSQA